MKLLPETAEGLLDLMNQMFPEPRPGPKTPPDEIRWAAAQRDVYLQMRDAYAAARRRS